MQCFTSASLQSFTGQAGDVGGLGLMVMDAATNASTTAGKCTLYSNGMASETKNPNRIAVNNSWFDKVPKNWVLV